MPQSRQLAAIMFTDIVGYTALMGNNEQKAFNILSKNRSIQKPIIEEYNGQWIKEMGDGTIATFPNASDAIMAALKIQEKTRRSNDMQGNYEKSIAWEEKVVEGKYPLGYQLNLPLFYHPDYFNSAGHQQILLKMGFVN